MNLSPDDLQFIAIERVPGDVIVSDADVESIARLTGLIWLDLHSTALTDHAMPDVARLTSLRHLNLTWVKEITDDGIRSLAALPNIEHFFGGSEHVTDPSLDVYATWAPTLRGIRFGESVITDDGMARLPPAD
jgi:hypothetical protein